MSSEAKEAIELLSNRLIVAEGKLMAVTHILHQIVMAESITAPALRHQLEKIAQLMKPEDSDGPKETLLITSAAEMLDAALAAPAPITRRPFAVIDGGKSADPD